RDLGEAHRRCRARGGGKGGRRAALMDHPPPGSSSLAFLAHGGEMGARMRAMDWSTTPLGSPDTWPQSLPTTLSMLPPSKAHTSLFWGPEFIAFYNDAYRPVFGADSCDCRDGIYDVAGAPGSARRRFRRAPRQAARSRSTVAAVAAAVRAETPRSSRAG